MRHTTPILSFLRVPARPFVVKFFGFSMVIFFVLFVILPLGSDEVVPIPNDVAKITAFSNPKRIWGNGVESTIEEAFRQCFKTSIIGGRVMNLRMPFAENHERDKLVEGGWEFLGKGKSDPQALWPVILSTFRTEDFARYVQVLGSGREQVIIFDIPSQIWSVSGDIFDIARMKAGSYHGLPHKPFVLVSGNGITESDVYNYLYCVAWTGMDCSGFVWHTLSYIASKAGDNLGLRFQKVLGTPLGGDPSFYAGTKFYNSKTKEILDLDDKIRNLKPADILLFRAPDGTMAHSAIIQSVDFALGVVRYLQDTDEAPQEERGVHESFIYFNPRRTNVSLKDESLKWTQKRFSPFPGENESAFSDDGKRYRAYGGGRAVRLRVMQEYTKTLR
ncbi:hypothetical protein AGMMS50212_10500 [Spirochaetia bacterium]|nr:hypothetical protein AGMMS50212_10500 [Spirochaetia bacterium]